MAIAAIGNADAIRARARSARRTAAACGSDAGSGVDACADGYAGPDAVSFTQQGRTARDQASSRTIPSPGGKHCCAFCNGNT